MRETRLGPKQQVFASLAEIAQALGHAHRLELLEDGFPEWKMAGLPVESAPMG
jgi:hypothetical protein